MNKKRYDTHCIIPELFKCVRFDKINVVDDFNNYIKLLV